MLSGKSCIRCTFLFMSCEKFEFLRGYHEFMSVGSPEIITVAVTNRIYCHVKEVNSYSKRDNVQSSGSQPLETLGPLAKFCLGSRTTKAVEGQADPGQDNFF